MTTPRRLTIQEVADLLDVHYTTAYRYVRTGRLPATRTSAGWTIAKQDVDAFKRGNGAVHAPTSGQRAPNRSGPRSGRSNRRRAEDLARELADVTIRGDEAGAWRLLQQALSSSFDHHSLYLEVIAPALTEIGDRWADGRIDEAGEHRASAVIIRLLGRLGPTFRPPGRRRGRILVTTPPDEMHSLPGTLVSDLLRGRGFDVIELGAGVPITALRDAVLSEPDLGLVAICVTIPGALRSTKSAVALLQDETTVPIIVGGAATAGLNRRQMPADALTGTDAEQFLVTVERLISR